MGFFDKLFGKRPKKKKKTVGTVPTQEKEPVYPPVKPVGSTQDLLKEWSKTLEVVEKHPLSQARVINTGVLTDLTHILNSMNEKLDSLAKLDQIIGLLMETKNQLVEAKLPTNNIDAVISSIKGLSVKDQEALEFFKDDELLTTDEFAKRSGLSRSTASSRLNKLFSFSVVEKVAEGKKIMYKRK